MSRFRLPSSGRPCLLLKVPNEYKHTVELWTEGDNQAKILLKEKGSK